VFDTDAASPLKKMAFYHSNTQIYSLQSWTLIDSHWFSFSTSTTPKSATIPPKKSAIVHITM
jgi:hypothetical protein